MNNYFSSRHFQTQASQGESITDIQRATELYFVRGSYF